MLPNLDWVYVCAWMTSKQWHTRDNLSLASDDTMAISINNKDSLCSWRQVVRSSVLVKTDMPVCDAINRMTPIRRQIYSLYLQYSTLLLLIRVIGILLVVLLLAAIDRRLSLSLSSPPTDWQCVPTNH